MDLPIIKNLKQKRRKEIAQGQDLVIQEIYKLSKRVVLHGGTAIWRCYGGNRFSWDLDFYFPFEFKSKLKELKKNLEEIGIDVKKLKTTENSIYATLVYKKRTIKFGGLFKNIKQVVTKQYKLIDGTSIVVNTLSLIELLKEKIAAYLNRRKIRDLYDVYYLSDLVEEKSKIKLPLSKLLKSYKQPKNKKQLQSLIITGVAPNEKDIKKQIKRWAK